MNEHSIKPTKRARKVIKQLEFIKRNYVWYLLGPDESEWKKALARFAIIEDFIIEMSAGKRVMEAELAEKIKSDTEEQ